MIKEIKINNSTNKVIMKKEDRFLGVKGENKYETLKFVFEDIFLNGEGILEIQKPNSQKEYIILDKEEDCYLLEVKNSLLNFEGEIIMQLVVRMTDNRVFKSVEFSMQVLKAIEATTEIPDEYETWDSTLAAKILEIDSKLEDMTELEQDLEDKVESGYFKGEKGDTGEPGQNGTNGVDGQDGQDGEDGKSAYQIWLDEGNVGTEQDFLDSLKGADGIDGKDGKDGVDGTNGQDGYTPIKGVDYWTNQDKAEIVQSSVTQVETDIQPTLTSIENTADTANSTANTAKSIAEGANQALSYGNYQTMITAFNALANNIYNVGQNVMIITLEVPDLWISSIESTSQTYTYTTDEAFTTALATNGYVQVGYYKLSALETQKVDLTDYVKFNNYPSASTAGVIKILSTYATAMDGQGRLISSIKSYNDYSNGNNGMFISKGTLENVITGKNLETGNNKVTSISSSSTNTEYPSAKAVYDYIQSLDGDEVSY